jgi:hypothetical protein
MGCFYGAARALIVWTRFFKIAQHMPGTFSSPNCQQAVVFIRQSAAPANRYESFVTDFRQYHSVPMFTV